MGRRHQLRGIVAENQKLSERDRRTLKRIVSKNHRTAAAEVTVQLTIHLKTIFPQKQFDESFTNPTSTVKLQL
jgi:hypothetical protein